MIDYKKLSDALDYYQQLGYRRMEVPWIISKHAAHVTCPSDRRPFIVDELSALVGSAEQSFIQLGLMDSGLPPGRYCAITPCFRHEGVLDKFHQEYFMKVELIETQIVNEIMLEDVVDDARKLFSKYIECDVVMNIDDTCITGYSYDIETRYGGIELGSYGIREHDSFKWVFGTGLAEPRLSIAMDEEAKLITRME